MCSTLKPADDFFVDLRQVAEKLCSPAIEVKNILQTNNVFPIRDSDCPAFCLYWASDIVTYWKQLKF